MKFDWRPFQKRNWDGEGAKPIRKAVIDRARALVEALGEREGGWIMPGPNGSVSVVWGHMPWRLHIQLHADGQTQIYMRDTQKRSAEIVVPGRGTPSGNTLNGRNDRN